jgi:ribosome-associated toxin RatA of RatAB toxin-antitoxin module
MPTVTKSVLVARSAGTMFALVDDVEHYPEFLPWCRSTTVFERTDEITRARLDIDYRGLRTHITTLNRKQAPTLMTLEFVEGPFERFGAKWIFTPLGDAGCRVEYAMEYRFASAAFERVVAPVFGYIAATLVDRFVARAEAGS